MSIHSRTNSDAAITAAPIGSTPLEGLIKQRADDDCTLCAIAMATGIPYERVVDVAAAAEHGYVPGKGTASTKGVLRALGIEAQRAYRKNITSPDFFRLLWGRRAIIELPSLNEWDGHHDVCWDGYRILDPSNKKTYSPDPAGLEPWVVTLLPAESGADGDTGSAESAPGSTPIPTTQPQKEEG